MSNLDPTDHNAMFAAMTAGLDLGWDPAPSVGGLVLPTEWRPRDGVRVGLDARVGQALCDALFQELGVIKRDCAELGLGNGHPRELGEVYTDTLLQFMQKAEVPVSPGEEVAVDGTALVLAGNLEDGFEYETLKPGTTLFGAVSGPGYGEHMDAEAGDILAYDPSTSDELGAFARIDLVLVLAKASLCSNEGYGPLEWEADMAFVPLANRTVRVFGTVPLL